MAVPPSSSICLPPAFWLTSASRIPAIMLRLPLGFVHALYLLLKLRPAGIVSFGGYLAVPTVICGWLLGIPSITHEQTIVAGYANKILSHFVKKIALTWPQSFS